MKDNDHDILIRVETKLESLTDEVRLMRDGTKEQITTLFATKLDKKTYEAESKNTSDAIEKHDRQIGRLTWLVYIGVGIILTLQFVALIVNSKA